MSESDKEAGDFRFEYGVDAPHSGRGLSAGVAGVRKIVAASPTGWNRIYFHDAKKANSVRSLLYRNREQLGIDRVSIHAGELGEGKWVYWHKKPGGEHEK